VGVAKFWTKVPKRHTLTPNSGRINRLAYVTARRKKIAHENVRSKPESSITVRRYSAAVIKVKLWRLLVIQR